MHLTNMLLCLYFFFLPHYKAFDTSQSFDKNRKRSGSEIKEVLYKTTWND